MKAEMEVMLLQSKESSELPATHYGRAMEQILSHALRINQLCWLLDLRLLASRRQYTSIV